MCNYFGHTCSGPTGDDLKRYSDQAQREYKAMVASHTMNPPGLTDYYHLLAAAAPDDPQARKGESQAEARTRRWNWLTQNKIDGDQGMKYNDEIHWWGCGCKKCNPYTPPRRSVRQWLGESSGPVLTFVVLVFVGLVLWAIVCIPGFVDVVSTAIKG
jgi:hypothetical protein